MEKPLVFVGSNYNMHWIKNVAEDAGFSVAGVVDDDYHGQGHFQGIPIIAQEQELLDNSTRWNQYQFFCATNWQPADVRDQYQERNQNKRTKLINLVEQCGFDVATIISPRAELCRYNVKIGRGVFIDSFCYVASNVDIGDYTTIYLSAVIADLCRIGKNCVLQRRVLLTGDVTVGDNVYMAVDSTVNKNHVTIASGTFIQQGIMVLRSTQENETIGLAGKDLRRIYYNPIEVN